MLRLPEVTLQADHDVEMRFGTIVTTIKIDTIRKVCILPAIS